MSISAENKDYFEILGITPKQRREWEQKQLSHDDVNSIVKNAYRKQAVKWHPDKNIGNEAEATQRFQAIQTAYEMLRTPQGRNILAFESSITAPTPKPTYNSTTEEDNRKYHQFFFFSASVVPENLAPNHPRFYQTKMPYSRIQQEFEDFIKDHPELSGFAHSLRESPNGQMLVLTFPSLSSAIQFINRLLDKNLIKDVTKVMMQDENKDKHFEEPKEAHRFRTPFDNVGKIPRLTRDR